MLLTTIISLNVTRHCLVVSIFPLPAQVQIFQPPHKRLEDAEEHQRDLEQAFEDMYMMQTGQPVKPTSIAWLGFLNECIVRLISDLVAIHLLAWRLCWWWWRCFPLRWSPCWQLSEASFLIGSLCVAALLFSASWLLFVCLAYCFVNQSNEILRELLHDPMLVVTTTTMMTTMTMSTMMVMMVIMMRMMIWWWRCRRWWRGWRWWWWWWWWWWRVVVVEVMTVFTSSWLIFLIFPTCATSILRLYRRLDSRTWTSTSRNTVAGRKSPIW